MRIDYQQADHLRVGRLIIARARQVESGPIVDGGRVGLVRIDEDAARAVVAAAGLLHVVAGEDRFTVIAEPTLRGLYRLRDGLHELGRTIDRYEQARTDESFGALVFHLPGSPRAVAVGWLNRHAPNPRRWRPRFLLERARWVLAGRPANVVSLGTDNSHACDDGATPAVFDTPFGDPPAVHR